MWGSLRLAPINQRFYIKVEAESINFVNNDHGLKVHRGFCLESSSRQVGISDQFAVLSMIVTIS